MRPRKNHVRVGRALGVLGALIALASPGLADTPKRAPAAKSPTTLSPRPQLPPYTKLQYDSVQSVNDRCAVRHGHLNANIRPVYINRQPVGFC